MSMVHAILREHFPTRLEILLGEEFEEYRIVEIMKQTKNMVTSSFMADAYAHIEKFCGAVDHVYLPESIPLSRFAEGMSNGRLWEAEVIVVPGLHTHIFLEDQKLRIRVHVELLDACRLGRTNNLVIGSDGYT